ncbi:DUF3606 domain-containing protein [Flavobacterium chungbukense]|uniref:DUF3606 domain-containing protein n=1 Tax=Flavobacterium chungbukense TaxID=877464 RepID=A0ABP7YEB7_9FLAO|nr:DUF3606 domain-containing protein [Flavobacterium chungbukense]MCC4920548.1 DUF3606 domain-containing protein [Flavobacterium chungbukense]
MENINSIGQEVNSHINISEQAEIQQWAEKLNVPEEILKNAVRAAGSTVEEVTEHLDGNPPSRESASETVRMKDGPWHDNEKDSSRHNAEGKSIGEATDPSKLSQL